MLRLLRVAWLLTLLSRSLAAQAQTESCPEVPGPWIAVIFSGPAWSGALRDGVIRELRTELLRRSLAVCEQPAGPTEVAPVKVITLLAPDPDRVSIVASDMEEEGGFTGRTIMVSAIPEDAQALAIAQAVDESLRNEERGTTTPIPAREPSVARPVPRPTTPVAPQPSWFIGAAVAPAIQIAPATSNRSTVVSPGVALRLSLGQASVGGSLGVTVTRASELSFTSASIRDFRIPADASLSLQVVRGAFHAALDAGVVAALVSYEYGPTSTGRSALELGGRAGARIAWGRRILPWVGASIEVIPNPAELQFVPTGAIGHAPSIWLGFALGTEIRWP